VQDSALGYHSYAPAQFCTISILDSAAYIPDMIDNLHRRRYPRTQQGALTYYLYLVTWTVGSQ